MGGFGEVNSLKKILKNYTSNLAFWRSLPVFKSFKKKVFLPGQTKKLSSYFNHLYRDNHFSWNLLVTFSLGSSDPISFSFPCSLSETSASVTLFTLKPMSVSVFCPPKSFLFFVYGHDRWPSNTTCSLQYRYLLTRVKFIYGTSQHTFVTRATIGLALCTVTNEIGRNCWKRKEILFIVLGIIGLKTDKIHLPWEVIILAVAVNTIQIKNIAAGLIVLKFHRSICHKSAKIIGYNVSLTQKYLVILIYLWPMADDNLKPWLLKQCNI